MSRFCLAILFLSVWALSGGPEAGAQMLYESNRFHVTDTSVVQGDFRAVAESDTRIASNYQRERTAINFKFSINGRDNERPSGDDIRLRLSPAGGRVLTPVYVFGEREPATLPQPDTTAPRPEEGRIQVVFRVDVKPMLRAFRQKGVYNPPSGDPIREEDFEGLYIFGDTAPLTWDLSRASEGERFRLTDPDGDGVYTIRLPFQTRDLRPLDDAGRAVWTLSEDVSDLPQLDSDQRLIDALYNLSLEETKLSIRDDGAFMAGEKWTGVWTRDVSYSILLSLALAQPEAAKASLLAKVDDAGRIIQDTGTGGSWPVSSDRMTWALAAWEVYLTTGDRDWLRRAYDVIQRSARADLHAVYDSTTGLGRGESSFMDWREQSYPDWMDPRDIYLSHTLSTNAVHHRTYRILSEMAQELGEPSEAWTQVADSIRAGVNEHLWLEEKGLYSEFRYGRNAMSAVDRTEALGSALAIVTGLAPDDRARRAARNHPVVEFGVPSFWPYIPGIPPYHNAGYWPFVGAYWTWAGAETGNTPGVEHGLGTLYRAAALFLTNKENMVAATGHFEGTQINSDRQLWSVAGTLASVYRILFGMRFERDGLRFQPFIPEGYTGTRTLTGVQYRDATLDVTVRGHGHRIVQITLDGEPLDEPVVPADLSGQHSVRIVMNGGLPDGSVRLVENRYTPATPDVSLAGDALAWEPVPEADRYRIVRNGVALDTVATTRFDLPDAPAGALAEYQVAALGADGLASFLSEPVRYVADDAVTIVDAAATERTLAMQDPGFTGEGYLPLTQSRHTEVTLQVRVDKPGRYAVDVRYANGHGPVNTENKCALRTLRVDGQEAGPVVMPQRGADVWNDWGYSNPVHVRLERGDHLLTLVYTELNENMNRDTNAAHLDHVRLTRVED